jgi:magnesium-protoporphyrin O-methyltransferase
MSGPCPDSCCQPEQPERAERPSRPSEGAIGEHFDKRYQDWEPIAPEATDLLFGWLRDEGLAGSSVMDIGCGTGELLVRAMEAGASRGTGADLSSEAIAMASNLAHERGFDERLDLWVGDAAVEALDRHDIVVLDKVICCYPDADALISRSTAAATRLYAFAVPESRGLWGFVARVRWFVFGTIEWLKGERLMRFVHDRNAVQEKVAAAGFRPLHTGRQFVWFVAVYGRESRD